MRKMKWLGGGPYRVWKNRLPGATLNVWENEYNDTITGSAVWKYPEFAGYYTNVRWMQFQTSDGPITAVLTTDDLYAQVLAPKDPPGRESRNAPPAVQAAGVAFLHVIPAS